MTEVAASGLLSYESISDIVEVLVNTEGRKYPIPGMSHEDIAQEIRAECVRLIPAFDNSRIGPSPYKFFQSCVKNFLYNLKRGIYVPNNPPCSRCPLWDKVRRTCVIDEIGCEKIVQYRKNMATKAALKAPASLESDIIDNNLAVDIEVLLLDESILSSLPPNLIPYYEKMKAGHGSKVPSRIKRQIRLIVRGILDA